ncbi:MAG: hypothetical protein ACKVQU_19525 [Burkholderiales bacterium]
MMKSVIRIAMAAVVIAFTTATYAQSGHGRGGREGHAGKLSPDERKALRHDIVQHGRDHYRGPPAPSRPVIPAGAPGYGGPGGPPGGFAHKRQ